MMTLPQTFLPSMPIEIVDDEDVALLLRRENVDTLVCISVEEIGHETPETKHKQPESSHNLHRVTPHHEFHYTHKRNIQVSTMDEFQRSVVPNMAAHLDDIREGLQSPSRHFSFEDTIEARFPHQRQASARVVEEHIQEKFHDHRLYKPKEIIHDMQKEFGRSYNYHKGYRARHIALEEVQGTPIESYNILPSYLYMLEQANHGTVTDLHTDSSNSVYKYQPQLTKDQVALFTHQVTLFTHKGSSFTQGTPRI
ncbi:hypothetical protein Ddye_028780 [Dipteronia dyeriana]|uniref:Uncharacterized protein n=1 Tax=Dipteronia dyeriana TaxID=168575 RepID=A0AAD9TDY1_9ROSI|nr:hypothetical protein Ddye_028780 [Dipteronia dyeriana]